MARRSSLAKAAVLWLLIFTGCAAPKVNTARENFYLGRFDEAEANLARIPDKKNDQVLLLMERAMIRQSLGHYQESAKDWIEAKDLAERLDFISISKTTASLTINDRVTAFFGEPYERTLLHSFAAKNYLATFKWDDAAVEARNIIYRLENRSEYPDDAYSRYMAGLCMEMIFDNDAASRQYSEASNLLPDITIDDSGNIFPSNRQPSTINHQQRASLVVFISIGRSPTEYGSWSGNWRWGKTPRAKIIHKGQQLGHSYTLADTQKIMMETNKRHAKLRAAKKATRIGLKEAAARAVAEENELLGELVMLALFAMEAPDTRRWETLPRWLQVARVPCPRNLKEYTVVFQNSRGQTITTKTIKKPLTRRGNVFVSFCRDL